MNANNPPRWALEDYAGAEEDFSNWLADQFLYHEFPQADQLDRIGLTRAQANARYRALQRTLSMKGLIDRAEVWQLVNANQTGWFRLLANEFDSVEELLANLMDGVKENSSEFYDLRYLAETLVPSLYQLGAKPEDVLGLAINLSKARAAIPHFRRILDQLEGPALEEEVRKTMAAIVDPELNVREFRRQLAERNGQVIAAPEPLIGERYILPEGDWLLIRVPSPAHLRAIQMALKGVVRDFDVRDAYQLIREVRKLLSPGGGHE